MSIESKVDFMRDVEINLADKLTANDLNIVMKAVTNVLEGFEMETAKAWDDDHDDLLKCYLSAMKVECRSQKTIDRYNYIIRKMMAFVKVPTRRVTVYHLRSYLAAEKDRGIADQTLEGYREIFSAYFNWLQRENLIEKNPTSNLGPVKCAKKEKKIYSDIELEKLNHNCKTIRDRAIINFLISTGCRISEMTELNRDSVMLDTLECVVHGKGNKERTVYINAVAGMFLEEYLKSRIDNNPALFIGKRNERLTSGGVRIMLNKIASAAGVEHVHPHKFRRTLATNLSRHGMPLQEVANILGHEKLDTTMRYVMLNKDDIKSSYRRFA